MVSNPIEDSLNDLANKIEDLSRTPILPFSIEKHKSFNVLPDNACGVFDMMSWQATCLKHWLKMKDISLFSKINSNVYGSNLQTLLNFYD